MIAAIYARKSTVKSHLSPAHLRTAVKRLAGSTRQSKPGEAALEQAAVR